MSWWVILLIAVLVVGLCWYGCKKSCKPKGP